MQFKLFPNERQLDMEDSGSTCLKMIAKYDGKYDSVQFFRDPCGVSQEWLTL